MFTAGSKWALRSRQAIVIGLLVSGQVCSGQILASSLVDAAQNADRASVLSHLDASGTDVNATAPDGSTALHWAVYHDDADLVERLLDAGARVDVINNYGASPMGEAAVAGNPRVIGALLDAGADVESANNEGQTALMLVARSGNVDAARVLIEHGADVDAVESWRGQTALIWAAAQSQPDMLRLLIDNGADVNARSTLNKWERQITAEPRFMWRPSGGFTALIYAAREGCLDCVTQLVEAGANLDQADGESRTPLLIAIMNLHFDTARYLIEAGANVNKWDLWGEQPLYAAVDMHTLPAGGYPDRPSLDDTTALDIVDLLLARGANPNAQLKLMLHHRHITDDRGADPILDINATPLLRAAKALDVPVVERLLDHGALPDLPNLQQHTPLMAAAGLGVTHVDIRSKPLAPDAQQKAIATIDLLLAAGADINARNNRGFSPLHGAAFWGWTDVVRHLVANGADPLQTSLDGFTALDVALGDVMMGLGRGAATAERPETAAVLTEIIAASEAE